MKIYRPLWNEGALLSPQQFQQQSAWEAFTNAGVSALSTPFPWGVESVELDDELLSSGRIQVVTFLKGIILCQAKDGMRSPSRCAAL